MALVFHCSMNTSAQFNASYFDWCRSLSNDHSTASSFTARVRRMREGMGTPWSFPLGGGFEGIPVRPVAWEEEGVPPPPVRPVATGLDRGPPPSHPLG